MISSVRIPDRKEFVVVSAETENPKGPAVVCFDNPDYPIKKRPRAEVTANLTVASWSGEDDALVAFLRTDGKALILSDSITLRTHSPRT